MKNRTTENKAWRSEPTVRQVHLRRWLGDIKDVMLKGKSRARAQGRFLQPPDKSEAPAAILEDEAEQIKKLPKRHASVYDAVAGGALISLPSIV